MYEKGGGPAHQCSHTFQVLGVGHIQENLRSSNHMVPGGSNIVSTSMENGNACQHSPGHGNKMYERLGGPAHQCSHTSLGAGSVFQDSDKVSRYLTSVWARGPSMPIENREARFEYRGSRIENREISRLENWESRIEDRGSRRGSRIDKWEARIEDRGSRIENWEWGMGNWESRIGNREARIQDRGARIQDRGSRIENGSFQARWGKLMRMADWFRTEWKFQCSNDFKCFLLLPNDSASFLRKLNATNFKASWKEISSRVQLSCF